VDVVTPLNPTDVFADLLNCLREKYPIFCDVVHLFEPSSGQSFFVNAPLFLDKLADDSMAAETSPRFDRLAFVCLTDFPLLLPSLPRNIVATLNSMKRQLTERPPTVSLSPDLTQDITIPLAAFLLDYPVAYVPVSPDQAIFLPGVPLDVFECFLHVDEGDPLLGLVPKQHTLLKFSCPSIITATHSERLAPALLVAQMIALFDAKVQRYGLSLDIRHTMETLDRVAL